MICFAGKGEEISWVLSSFVKSNEVGCSRDDFGPLHSSDIVQSCKTLSSSVQGVGQDQLALLKCTVVGSARETWWFCQLLYI